jgi:hypothetical protein
LGTLLELDALIGVYEQLDARSTAHNVGAVQVHPHHEGRGVQLGHEGVELGDELGAVR